MLVEQRHDSLLQELRAAGSVRVAELAARLGVSAGTIRRDIADLALQGKLVKVRGGAIAPSHELVASTPEEPLAVGSSDPAAASPIIGLLVPSATYYFPQVVEGVRAVAGRLGSRVMIGLTDYRQPRDLARIDDLCAGGADGLLVASTGDRAVPRPTMERLRTCGLPFVLLERQPEDAYEPCEFVASDHRQGAYAAVRHLVGLGHSRVGLFATDTPTTRLVREGHGHAVRRLELDPAAPLRLRRMTADLRDPDDRDYEEFLDSCLATGTRAALVHSDQDAIELQQRLRARGLRTPEDLALIAYDDEIAELAEVPLTAVAPAKRQLGEQAARMLLDRLGVGDGGGSPLASRQVVLQPRLVVRDSCGAQLARTAQSAVAE